mmetsp:Transcript_45543/g.114596  ORF Transcript_45543/g.114596 Transcript_45543/m.114596 type:complete len:288 (-) Transcript_45543:1597-2460(-)
MKQQKANSASRVCSCDDIHNHIRFSQSRQIAQICYVGLVLGNLAQDAAHDLARTGFGKTGRNNQAIRLRDRTDQFANVLFQTSNDIFFVLEALSDGAERNNSLTLDWIRDRDNSRFGAHVRLGESTLNLGRAQTMSSFRDHVINTTADPNVAVLVLATSIASKVKAWILGNIGGFIARVITVHGSRHTGPSAADGHNTFHIAGLVLSVESFPSDRIENGQVDTEKGQSSRACFHGHCSWYRRTDNTTGFSLPVRIDNSTAFFTNHLMVPFPSFRIDRFSDTSENFQG